MSFKIVVSHPKSQAKLFETDGSLTWNGLKDELLKLFDDYQNYDAQVANKSLDWEIKDAAVQKDLIKFLLEKRRILLVGKVIGGSLPSDPTELTDDCRTQLQTLFIKKEDASCSFCYGTDVEVFNVKCGCNFCWSCFSLFLGTFAASGKETCPMLHPNDILQDLFDTLVQCNANPLLIDRVIKFIDCTNRIRNMNYTICMNCKNLLKNKTGYSCQTCIFCQKVFCFFCCNDWSKEKKNQIGCCSLECKYSELINPPLVEWKNAAVKGTTIPAHRFCPNCTFHGAFDRKCKMHTCRCKLEYCFFCLKSKDDCFKANPGKKHYDKCMEPVKQSLVWLWKMSKDL